MGRCNTKRTPGRGENIKSLCAVEATNGATRTETRRGSLNRAEFISWPCRMKAAIERGLAGESIIYVIDNAPTLSRLEERIQGFYPGLQVLRLGPYSPPLNPVEGCWSTVKANLKRLIVVGLEERLNVLYGQTQREHRAQCLVPAHSYNWAIRRLATSSTAAPRTTRPHWSEGRFSSNVEILYQLRLIIDQAL